MPSVTLQAGSARVGQAALVAAVTASLWPVGSTLPALCLQWTCRSRATHLQASARTAAEPPQASTVRGEAALKGLGRGQMRARPRSMCHCPQVLGRGYYGDPTLGSGYGASPAPVLHPGSASIMGPPAIWTAPVIGPVPLCPGYAGEARLAVTNPQPRSLVHSPVRSTEQMSAQCHLCV